MALILSRAYLQHLNPPMTGAVDAIEKCYRTQAPGDVTNCPHVHLAYPPTGESGKRTAFARWAYDLAREKKLGTEIKF